MIEPITEAEKKLLSYLIYEVGLVAEREWLEEMVASIKTEASAPWIEHRERCHNDNPDGTIAFIHQRADAANAKLAALQEVAEGVQHEFVDGPEQSDNFWMNLGVLFARAEASR